MGYRIVEWLERYEVNVKGQAAKQGDELRAKPLDYIRQKVNGRKQGVGYRRLLQIAGRENAMQVFGIFQKCLEIAGDSEKAGRGALPENSEIAFLLDIPQQQVDLAIAVLTKLGWISQDSPENAGNPPQILAAYITKPNPTEHNRTKQNNNTPGKSGKTGNIEKPVKKEKVEIGFVKNPQKILELDLLIKQKRDNCLKSLELIFVFNAREKTTFAAIAKYLTEQCQAGIQQPEVFNDVVRWAKEAKRTSATNKKGLLVKKIKEKTGYCGSGWILDRTI